MAPEARRKHLVEKAADFFSDEGFDAGTRQLARQLGVTQPLIYRYFSSKEELINAVYRKVYLDQWQDGWAATLRDRSRPMHDRLDAFYKSYAPAIFNRRWMRIFFFAGLKGLDINRRYLQTIAERLLLPICEEMRAELGHATDAPISQSEQELVWLMHGMVFYQGLRQHIYRSVEHVDYDFVVAAAIEMYLSRAPGVIAGALDTPEPAARGG
jgi:AcrR family transcriptional regulator